ncbi:MAG: glutamine amidotransferase family protein [Candidatus Hadarchaeota archaeon]
MRRMEVDRGGCSLFGLMDESGERFSGAQAIGAITKMQDRENGRGGGFAGYGIYPMFKDCQAFHLLYDSEKAKESTELYLGENYSIEKDEPIPTRKKTKIENPPLLWRYFLAAKESKVNGWPSHEDFVVSTVMKINEEIDGAYVISSGKNMGIFKGVGFAGEIGKFFRLDEYKGYAWTAHGRFPTNTVGWWGGSHPFGLLDWSVVHNGEISSYGANKRYLERFGYRCTLFTDTEVIAYLYDLLARKHGFGFDVVGKILASPFWDEIERLPGDQREICKALRLTYGGALLNGPFATVVGHRGGIVGINDRIKLRPLVAARRGSMLYLSSEESGIREVCQSPDKVWMPEAGEPVVGRLEGANG